MEGEVECKIFPWYLSRFCGRAGPGERERCLREAGQEECIMNVF